MGSRALVSRIDLNTLPPIIVEGKTIDFVNEVRNLGVIMTANLSWQMSCHVDLKKDALFFT